MIKQANKFSGILGDIEPDCIISKYYSKKILTKEEYYNKTKF